MIFNYVFVILVSLHFHSFHALSDVWEDCNISCGGGIQRRKGNRNVTRTCNLSSCPGDAGCITVHYTFETLMEGLVYDVSNNRNHGNINGAGRLEDNGKFGKCLHLLKSSNISLGNRQFHNRPSTAITVGLWVKLTSSRGDREIFNTCDSEKTNGRVQFDLKIKNGKVYWSHRDHMERYVFDVTSEARILTKIWTHIAVSYHTLTQVTRVYINGEMAKLSSNSQLSKFGSNARAVMLSPDWGCVNIGRNNRPLDGYIDDFFIFKCELQTYEITQLYLSGSFKRHEISTP